MCERALCQLCPSLFQVQGEKTERTNRAHLSKPAVITHSWEFRVYRSWLVFLANARLLCQDIFRSTLNNPFLPRLFQCISPHTQCSRQRLIYCNPDQANWWCMHTSYSESITFSITVRQWHFHYLFIICLCLWISDHLKSREIKTVKHFSMNLFEIFKHSLHISTATILTLFYYIDVIAHHYNTAGQGTSGWLLQQQS